MGAGAGSDTSLQHRSINHVECFYLISWHRGVQHVCVGVLGSVDGSSPELDFSRGSRAHEIKIVAMLCVAMTIQDIFNVARCMRKFGHTADGFSRNP